MIVTKVLCDNCREEIKGDPFVILKVNHRRTTPYCFKCGKVLLDGWEAVARQNKIDRETWKQATEMKGPK